MRILLTLDFPPDHGGIQRYLHDIVRFRYRKGDRVLVASRHGRDAVDERLRATVVRLVPPSIGSFNAMGIAVLTIGLLRTRYTGSVPVVECGNVYAGVAGLIGWLLRRQPYVVYTYGTELLGLNHRSLKSLLLRAVLRKANRLAALGEYTRRLVEELGVEAPITKEPPKIVLSDVAVHTPRDSSKNERRHTLRILSVGRLVPHKGHGVALQAVDRLPPAVDWTLVIVGNGPEREVLERACADGQRATRVHLLSGLTANELSRQYADADVFVLPSLTTLQGVEGFGIVMLEAMAHRVPVVASNTGGIPEVLDNGRCGVLVPPGDPAKLAEALVRVHTDSELRTSLVERAEARLRECYVWDA